MNELIVKIQFITSYVNDFWVQRLTQIHIVYVFYFRNDNWPSLQESRIVVNMKATSIEKVRSRLCYKWLLKQRACKMSIMARYTLNFVFSLIFTTLLRKQEFSFKFRILLSIKNEIYYKSYKYQVFVILNLIYYLWY